MEILIQHFNLLHKFIHLSRKISSFLKFQNSCCLLSCYFDVLYLWSNHSHAFEPFTQFWSRVRSPLVWLWMWSSFSYWFFHDFFNFSTLFTNIDLLLFLSLLLLIYNIPRNDIKKTFKSGLYWQTTEMFSTSRIYLQWYSISGYSTRNCFKCSLKCCNILLCIHYNCCWNIFV